MVWFCLMFIGRVNSHVRQWRKQVYFTIKHVRKVNGRRPKFEWVRESSKQKIQFCRSNSGTAGSIAREFPSSWSHAPCLHVLLYQAWYRTWPGFSWWAWSSATIASWGHGACIGQTKDEHVFTYRQHSPNRPEERQLTQSLCLPSTQREAGTWALASSYPEHRQSLGCWQKCDLTNKQVCA